MGVTITFNHFPALLKQIQENVPKIVDEYAAKLKEDAQRNMPRATGSAADGLYVLSPLRDEYSAAVGKAQSDNAHVTIADKVEMPKAGGAVVAGAAGHTIDVELGDMHMAARPSLVPATEALREPLLAALAKVFP